MVKNIVITGEGIVSAIGNDKESVLQSLKDKKTGIGRMKYLHSVHDELPVGEVKMSNDEMKSILGFSEDAHISRTVLMGILAVRQALSDGNVRSIFQKKKGLRVVLISGTTVGGMDLTEKFYKEMLNDNCHLECLASHDPGSSTKAIADYFDLFSDYTTISTACSSAANALILGANMIKDGEADIVVAGGSEALSIFHLNGFNSLMILDKVQCRPFDADRAGLNLGEGAAYVILESEEFAKLHNIPIHAYLLGYGNACDAFHQTASSENGDGAYYAMKGAIDMAHISPSDIQYVNAHGTGTPNNDITESKALQRVFTESVPMISSTKSFTGHATSASGAIESVICLLALYHQFVPANLGWEKPIVDGITPTLGEDNYPINTILCNSFGFGGNDSALLFSLHGADYNDCSQCNYTEKDIRVMSKVEILSEEDLSEISKYVKPLEARRMGKLMKSTMLSSLKALEIAGLDVPDAIITGTAWGCLENSEKLLEQISDEGECMLKPTYFMQSTHNTLSSSIAIRTHCHGYNITYSQGANSLEWAMRDAKRLLINGECKSVLVGCHDESTPTFRKLMERVGVKNINSIHSIALVLSCGK